MVFVRTHFGRELALVQPLCDMLNAYQADQDDILQAWTAVLGLEMPDVSTEDMRDELVAAVGHNRLDKLVEQLSRSPQYMERTGFLLLSAAWEDASDTTALANAVTASRQKMPLLEVGIIATSCIYGIYLLVTKGVKRKERKVVQRKDGTFEVTEITDYADLGGFISMVSQLFSGRHSQE